MSSEQHLTRPNPDNVEVQLNRLFDKDHVVRGAAAVAIGNLGKEADREIVLRALAKMAREDWDRRNRISALIALRKIGNPKALKMLRRWGEVLSLGLVYRERWRDVRAELKKTRKYLKSLQK